MRTQTYVIDHSKVKRLMLERWGTVEQKILAQKAGVTEQTLTRIFKGHGFSADSLFGICQVLNCTPNEILSIGPKDQTLAGVAAQTNSHW